MIFHKCLNRYVLLNICEKISNRFSSDSDKFCWSCILVLVCSHSIRTHTLLGTVVEITFSFIYSIWELVICAQLFIKYMCLERSKTNNKQEIIFVDVLNWLWWKMKNFKTDWLNAMKYALCIFKEFEFLLSTKICGCCKLV